jgi:hypothetical protein
MIGQEPLWYDLAQQNPKNERANEFGVRKDRIPHRFLRGPGNGRRVAERYDRISVKECSGERSVPAR